jgi:hypothetical protein
MGDTSFFIRYDIYSIFAIFFDTDIDIFLTRTTTKTKEYFHLFDAKIMLVEYVFNTFIFMIVTNITTNSDSARGPLSTIENELLLSYL